MASLSSIIACCWWLIILCYRYLVAALTIDAPMAYDSIPLIMDSTRFLVRWSGMQMAIDDNNMPITNMTMELYLLLQHMVVASWDWTMNTSNSHGSLILTMNSTMIMPPFEDYYLQLLVTKDHRQHQQIAVQGPISFHLHANTTATITNILSTTMVVPTAIPSPYITTGPTDTWIATSSTTYVVESTPSLAATGDANETTNLVSPRTRDALQGAAIAATAVIIVALVYGFIVCCINHRHKKKRLLKNKDRVVTFDNTTTVIMPPTPSCASGHTVNTGSFMGCYYDSEYFTDAVKSNVQS